MLLFSAGVCASTDPGRRPDWDPGSLGTRSLRPLCPGAVTTRRRPGDSTLLDSSPGRPGPLPFPVVSGLGESDVQLAKGVFTRRWVERAQALEGAESTGHRGCDPSAKSPLQSCLWRGVSPRAAVSGPWRWGGEERAVKADKCPTGWPGAGAAPLRRRSGPAPRRTPAGSRAT